MNKYDRHIEHLQLDEIQMFKRSKLNIKNLEDEVIINIENKKLHIAIQYSLDSALKNLKNFLK